MTVLMNYRQLSWVTESYWAPSTATGFHPSIKNIKRNYKITSKFSFKPVSEEFVEYIENNLSSNKAAGGELPLKF